MALRCRRAWFGSCSNRRARAAGYRPGLDQSYSRTTALPVRRWRWSGEPALGTSYDRAWRIAPTEDRDLALALPARGIFLCVSLDPNGMVPGLAPCDYHPARSLIPDSFFISRRGSADPRLTFRAKPGASNERARIVFWRGAPFNG
jgi:hypothetical protein